MMRFRLGLPSRQFLAAGCVATLTLVLLASSAHALKVQQAGDSPTIRTDLRRAGLEEPAAGAIAPAADPYIQERAAVRRFAERVEQLGGDNRALLELAEHYAPAQMAYLHPERYLDATKNQEALFRHGRSVQLSDGVLYAGLTDALGVIRAGSVSATALTRVGHQWAATVFRRSAPSPALLVVRAAQFNQWRREGRAVWELRSREGWQVEPYFSVPGSVTWDELFEGGAELWVPEDADRWAFPERWIDAGRIRSVPGLRSDRLPADGNLTPVRQRVGEYMLQRDFLKEIPIFEPLAGMEEERRESQTHGGMY